MSKFRVTATERRPERVTGRIVGCEPASDPSAMVGCEPTTNAAAMTGCDDSAAGCDGGAEAGPNTSRTGLEPLLPLDD